MANPFRQKLNQPSESANPFRRKLSAQPQQQEAQARPREGFVPPPESRRMEQEAQSRGPLGVFSSTGMGPSFVEQQRRGFLQEQQNVLKRTEESIKEEKQRKYYASEFFGQYDFGESDIGFIDRTMIARGDSLEEKQNIFSRIYPDGDLQRVPVSGDLVFRRDPSESYRILNPEGLDFTDVGQFAGEYGHVLLGEILGSNLTLNRRTGEIERLPKGSSLGRSRRVLSTLTRGAGGAVLGETVKQAEQYLTGVQEDPWATALLQKPATEGLFSFAGGSVAEIGFRGVDIALGSGLYTVTPGGARAMAAAERQGLPQPLPGQTTGSNFITRVQGQAGQLTARIQNYLDNANQRSVEAFRQIASLTPAERNASINIIQNGMEQAKSDFVRSLGRQANVSNQEFGQFVKTSYDQFTERTRTDVSNAYAIARSYLSEGDPIKFDISDLKTTAGEIADITKVTVVRDGTRQEQEITNKALEEVRELAAQIRDADPSTVGTEQMMAWEDRLVELATPPLVGDPTVPRRAMIEGGYTEANQKAITLKKSLKNSFDFPLNRGEDFTAAWKKARGAASERADTLNDVFAMYVAKTQEPSAVANYVFNPENIKPENVRSMFRVMDEQQREATQLAFFTNFLRNPDKINQTLDVFDEDVLTLMISPNELKRLREVGQSISNIDNAGIGRVLTRQEEFVPFFRELVAQNPQTVQTGNLFRLVQSRGGVNSPEGRAIKAALVEAIARDAVRLTGSEGRRKISASTLDSAMAAYEDRNLMRFLTADEVNTLRDLFDYVGAVQPQGEGVAGLLGAQTVAEATRGSPNAIAFLLRQIGVGNLITSSAGRRFLQGTVSGKTLPRNIAIPVATTVERVLFDQAFAGNSESLPEVSEMEEAALPSMTTPSQ